MFEGTRSILADRVDSKKPKKRDDSKDGDDGSAANITGRGGSLGDTNISSLLVNVRVSD